MHVISALYLWLIGPAHVRDDVAISFRSNSLSLRQIEQDDFYLP
jgi:hypothetical protein